MTRRAQALATFQADLKTTAQPRGHLVALEAQGWQEECPSEEGWHFTHKDFPGLMLNWSPGREPWVSGQEVR